MAKSILVFFDGKPFGIFSNKTNAWLAITDNYDLNTLRVYSEKKNEYLPATYATLAMRLSKTVKCHIFTQDALDKAKALPIEPVEPSDVTTVVEPPAPVPSIYVYQFETNISKDGKLYKSSDKAESAGGSDNEKTENHSGDDRETVPEQGNENEPSGDFKNPTEKE